MVSREKGTWHSGSGLGTRWDLGTLEGFSKARDPGITWADLQHSWIQTAPLNPSEMTAGMGTTHSPSHLCSLLVPVPLSWPFYRNELMRASFMEPRLPGRGTKLRDRLGDRLGDHC